MNTLPWYYLGCVSGVLLSLALPLSPSPSSEVSRGGRGASKQVLRTWYAGSLLAPSWEGERAVDGLPAWNRFRARIPSGKNQVGRKRSKVNRG
jgi:hypothetical protein